jgi:DNA-binding HxlR family transcriptional regulator
MAPGCPYQSAFDLLARRHALTIIWFLQQEQPRRFTQIKQECGVNGVTLSQRLGELETEAIITRQEFSELPPRVEYRLTPKGEDLVQLMEQICAWATKWDPQCQS